MQPCRSLVNAAASLRSCKCFGPASNKRPVIPQDALRMGINIELIAANQRDKRQVCFFCRSDCQGCRGRNSRQNWCTEHYGLLHHLHRDTTGNRYNSLS